MFRNGTLYQTVFSIIMTSVWSPGNKQSYASLGCGMFLKLNKASLIGGDSGDWKTTEARLLFKGAKTDSQSYILVSW